MNTLQPPRIAQWILEHTIAPNLRDGALGDFQQIYSETAETHGTATATLWYWRQVIRSLPFFISDTVIWTLLMLRNYFHVAYRSLYKNKTSSVVNIVGLSLAVATAITAFLFIEYQYTTDSFHANNENIFLVETYISRGSDVQLRGDTPIPLGPAMQAAIPQVKRSVRLAFGNSTFRSDDNTFRERVGYVDPEFLDMFSFNLRLGDKSSAIGHDDIVLSDALATKYFGKKNPIGQQITVMFDDVQTRAFTVKAVAAPFNTKASFTFSALLHYDHLGIQNIDLTDWGTTTRSTFIEIENPQDIDLVSKEMNDFKAQQNAVNENSPISDFRFANLRSLSRDSYLVAGDISNGSHPAGVIVLGLVALFMLLLSCINYMNLAIATASRRLREIGVRKALGSQKSQIIFQFLTENILICGLALALGITVAVFGFIPGFNSLNMGPHLSIGDADTMLLWTFLAVLLLFTGLVSGAYPAFYISSFRPTVIFRGNTSLGGENIFTRGLLTFQFVLAFLTMIMGVVLAQNATYQANLDWGYDQDHLLVIRAQDENQYSLLQSEIGRLPGVETIVGARDHFTGSWEETTVETDGEKFAAARFDVGEGFIPLYDLSVIAGSGFDASSMTETDGRVIVNELFATSRGWTADSAPGKTFREDSLSYAVAGVVSNLIYQGLFDPIGPMFMRAVPESAYRYMSIKLSPGTGVQTEEAVHALWKRLAPDQEYNGFFQDAVFQDAYRENNMIRTMFSFISSLALFIACMGLFGLVAQRFVRRMREISIRKVMGASVFHLVKKINLGFVVILVIAAVIATPLGYVVMKTLLASIYANPVPIGPSAFIISFSLILLTALLTIASQIGKFVRASPAEVLRNQ